MSDLSYFDHYQKYDRTPLKIKILNSNKLTITHIGNVKLFDETTLNNVLYALGICYDLISMSCLTDQQQCVVAFFPNVCFLQGLSSGSMRVIGRINSGLYVLNESLVSSNVSVHNLAVDNTIWHLRLGHPSNSILR